jgi:hypothetical protein
VIIFNFRTINDAHIIALFNSTDRPGFESWGWLRDALDAEIESRANGEGSGDHGLDVDDLDRPKLVALIAGIQNLRDGFARDRRPSLAALFADLLSELVAERLRRDEQAAALERMGKLDDFAEPETAWTPTV